MASAKYFDGNSSIRTILSKKGDRIFFEDMLRKLGLASLQHLSLTQLYFVIGVICVEKGFSVYDDVEPTGMKELVKIDSFKKAPFYDNIICNYLSGEGKEGVRNEFEHYQYIGFRYLNEWGSKHSHSCSSPLERICSIWDQLDL